MSRRRFKILEESSGLYFQNLDGCAATLTEEGIEFGDKLTAEGMYDYLKTAASRSNQEMYKSHAGRAYKLLDIRTATIKMKGSA